MFYDRKLYEKLKARNNTHSEHFQNSIEKNDTHKTCMNERSFSRFGKCILIKKQKKTKKTAALSLFDGRNRLQCTPDHKYHHDMQSIFPTNRRLGLYFRYIVAIRFNGRGNRRKPSTCRKSLTNFLT